MATPTLTIIRKDAWVPDPLAEALKKWSPKSEVGKFIHECVLQHLPMEMAAELIDRFSSIVVLQSQLALAVRRANGSIEDYGVVGHKVITTAGVNFLVDAFQNTTELENMKFHGIGTGSTAEAAGDTALVTELTTEYSPDSTRATGSTTEGAGANIYRTVGTNTLDATPGAALREHGIFSAASAGTLWDRTVYAAITLSSGDSLQSTYDMTASSGG